MARQKKNVANGAQGAQTTATNGRTGKKMSVKERNKLKRERYQNDPAYRAAMKEASRISHEKARRAKGILPREQRKRSASEHPPTEAVGPQTVDITGDTRKLVAEAIVSGSDFRIFIDRNGKISIGEMEEVQA